MTSKFDGRGLKGVRVEHPSGNQPFIASFSDQTKMSFPFCVLLPKDCASLPVERMVAIADLDLVMVLAYLARYTHRVAISNSRLIAAGTNGVTFKYKDYRVEGPDRHKRISPRPARCSPFRPWRRPTALKPLRKLSRSAPASWRGHARAAAGA